jgi:uncharacterized protein
MNMNEMIKRSFDIREANEEKREVSGIAVPYNEKYDLGNGKYEQFARGSVDTTSHVKLFRDHEEIIGVVTEMNDTETGLEIKARISETVLGNETLSLVKDGAIRSFSVGFIPLENKTDGNTVIRTRVDLKEVSLVPFPAYDNAAVLAVREEKTNQEEKSMENTTPDYDTEIKEIRNQANELERKLEVISSDKASTPAVPNFRSFGHYVKAVAAGSEEGLAAYRAFGDENSILTDTISNNQFVIDTIRILNNGRPTYSVFATGALPAAGMTLEFPKITTDTTQVTEQAAIGDTLAFGKINLETGTATVKTYGGYTGMAKQVVERSSVGYVDAAFRSLVSSYAKATNTAVRASLVANAANFNSSALGAWTATEIVDSIAEAAAKVNVDTGLPLEFILVSTDVFRNLAKAVDGSGRPLLANVGATVNTFGSINPVGLTGNILGLPVVLDPSLANLSFYAGNSAALVNYESAGAPFRLTDENIEDLSNKMSVYGYLATAVVDPKALCVIA